MTRLIDADELNEYIGRESLDTREKIFALVDRMPTLPSPCGKPCAFERPYGEWIEKPWGVVCSRCKAQALHTPNGNQLRSDYCPDCGALMRKEGEQK